MFKNTVRGLFSKSALALLVMTVMLLGVVEPTMAADTSGVGGGPGLPWEGPLDKLQQSISGPVAFVIALLGIIACGATLIWGGEVSEFTRRIIYVVLVVCIIVFANTMLTGALFSGAMIPADATLTLPDSNLAADLGERSADKAADLVERSGVR